MPEADLPVRVSLLRWKLGRKAKHEPTFRFYNLFGRVCRRDVLEAAWQRVRRNQGSAGSDGVTITAVETAEGGVSALLDDLAEALRTRPVSPATGATCLHSEAGRPASPAGDPHGAGPRRANGSVAGDRADLRGGLRGLLLRVSSGANAHQAIDQILRDAAGWTADGVRRGSGELLRHD